MKKNEEELEIDESKLSPEQYEELHKSNWSWPWFIFFVVMGLLMVGMVITILVL